MQPYLAAFFFLHLTKSGKKSDLGIMRDGSNKSDKPNRSYRGLGCIFENPQQWGHHQFYFSPIFLLPLFYFSPTFDLLRFYFCSTFHLHFLYTAYIPNLYSFCTDLTLLLFFFYTATTLLPFEIGMYYSDIKSV